MGIVYRAIATHLTHKAGFTPTTAKTGAVKQRQGVFRPGGKYQPELDVSARRIQAALLQAADDSFAHSVVSDKTWATLASRYSTEQMMDVVQDE